MKQESTLNISGFKKSKQTFLLLFQCTVLVVFLLDSILYSRELFDKTII